MQKTTITITELHAGVMEAVKYAKAAVAARASAARTKYTRINFYGTPGCGKQQAAEAMRGMAAISTSSGPIENADVLNFLVRSAEEHADFEAALAAAVVSKKFNIV